MNFHDAFIDELVKVAAYMTSDQRNQLHQNLKDKGIGAYERGRLVLREKYKMMNNAEKLKALKKNRFWSRALSVVPYGVGNLFPHQGAAMLVGGKKAIRDATERKDKGSMVLRHPLASTFWLGAFAAPSTWRAYNKGSLIGDEIARLEKKVNKKDRK